MVKFSRNRHNRTKQEKHSDKGIAIALATALFLNFSVKPLARKVVQKFWGEVSVLSLPLRRGSTSSLSNFLELYGAASVAPMWFSIELSLLLKGLARSLTEKSRGISWKYPVDNFTGLAQRGVAMNPTDSRDFCKCVGAFRTRERIVHWTQEVIVNIAKDACGIRTMSSPRVKLMSSLVFNPRFFSPCSFLCVPRIPNGRELPKWTKEKEKICVKHSKNSMKLKKKLNRVLKHDILRELEISKSLYYQFSSWARFIVEKFTETEVFINYFLF